MSKAIKRDGDEVTFVRFKRNAQTETRRSWLTETQRLNVDRTMAKLVYVTWYLLSLY